MKLWQSIKVSLTNKKFVIFALCSTLNWYVFSLLPTIMPIYIKTVIDPLSDGTWIKLESLGELRISIPLVVAFLSSIVGVLFWSWIDRKLGSKLGFILSMSWWAVVLIPLIFMKRRILLWRSCFVRKIINNTLDAIHYDCSINKWLGCV